MLLSFTIPYMIPRIKNLVKRTTIREDKHNRWKVGMKIHFWFGNPRNKKAKVKPYHFGMGAVTKIEKLTITQMGFQSPVVRLDMRELSKDEVRELAIVDGFDNEVDFFKFFSDDFTGKRLTFIIDTHWDYLTPGNVTFTDPNMQLLGNFMHEVGKDLHASMGIPPNLRGQHIGVAGDVKYDEKGNITEFNMTSASIIPGPPKE